MAGIAGRQLLRIGVFRRTAHDELDAGGIGYTQQRTLFGNREHHQRRPLLSTQKTIGRARSANLEVRMRTRALFFYCLSLILTGAPCLLSAAVTDGLIGYWTFDQTNGAVALDSTTNANHGALNNFPADNSQWEAGRIGGALNFRGPANADYVRVTNYPKPTTGMTASAWVWADARPTWASILKNWGGAT